MWWSWGGEKQSSISFYIAVDEDDESYIRLTYTHTDWGGDEVKMDYKVRLIATRCNYGGVRWWFECPLYKNGRWCGKRVGVLYGASKYFGCRYCMEVAYQAQFEGGPWRFGSLHEDDVEQAYREVKQKFYAGKPTRKYLRAERLSEKMGLLWRRWAMSIEKRR
jgi:hypothetical protein